MLTLRNAALARAGKVLFEEATLMLPPGCRAGIVGPNGSGKSSLFALLRGELQTEAGDAEIVPGAVVAHVAQETPPLPMAAIEYVLDGDAELRAIERDIAAATASDDGVALAHLHDRFEQIDGYPARARAATLLSGLGFAAAWHERPVAEFSGGFRMRLNLAQALMCRSDLLLLDEPTNHLDLDAVLWLEQFLFAYRGTLLLISHDRDFLDGIATHIVHFSNARLRLYTGNYSAFERQRAASLAVERASYEKQQREIAHLHSFIDRFRAKATKARQAQSRIKALARMEEIAPAHVDSPFTFRFREFGNCADPLLTVENVAAGYGEHTVLDRIELTIRPGMRIGLLGRNGAGKSTLIKLLAGELKPLRGTIHEGKGLAIGYFAQHQLEQLREDSPLAHLVRIDPSAREQDLRDYLGSYGFSGDQATVPVGPFSGGEKARLVLALLAWRKPNLLLLDEPTNHLDLEVRHALTLALQEYEGAVLVVSHDRHLLRTTVDEFLRVTDGRVEPFTGDLDDYRAWLATGDTATVGQAGEDSGLSRKEERRLRAEQVNAAAARRRPMESELKKLDREIDRLSAEKKRLDMLLASEASYAQDAQMELKRVVAEHGSVAQKLESAEERWLTLQEELEALKSV